MGSVRSQKIVGLGDFLGFPLILGTFFNAFQSLTIRMDSFGEWG